MTGTIYLLKNKQNGKPYVGQSVDFKDRIAEHARARNDYAISRAIRKYGWESFEVTILHDNVSLNDLYVLEKHCIWIYDSFLNGYNSSMGGEGGCLGYRHSEETKNQISTTQQAQAERGEHSSQRPDVRAKISATNRDNAEKGIHSTQHPDVRARISKKLRENAARGEHSSQQPEWSEKCSITRRKTREGKGQLYAFSDALEEKHADINRAKRIPASEEDAETDRSG